MARDANPRYWVEKTIIRDRPDRNVGPHALGQALWSPQRADDNRDIYHLLQDVKPGDIVFHFVDNSELRGVSVAASVADTTFVGLKGTEWADRPAYRIALRDYRQLVPPINRTEFLQDPKYRGRIERLLTGRHGLFFNREFKLNQGSYLTAAPPALVKIWDEIHRKKTGQPLLPGLELSVPSQLPADDETGIELDGSIVERLAKSFSDSGFAISTEKLIQCLASLATKRFLILTGLSGSGKTRLAQAIARSMVPEQQPNAFYAVIPVGADWTGNENILGYPDALDPRRYVCKPALEIVLHSLEHPATPHFLILDEMNLSHVERYFADILSALESEEKIPLYRGIAREANGQQIPEDLQLSDNLFIIGTVNIDETTYMFSSKVLDRASVIEFRLSTNEIERFLRAPVKPALSALDGCAERFGNALVAASTRATQLRSATAKQFEKEMLLFFQVLQPQNVEFGYRVIHEAARFMAYHHQLSEVVEDNARWFSSAFDCIVIQRLLPKLHGSRTKLGPVLKKLWFLCVVDESQRGSDPLAAVEDAGRSTAKTSEPSTQIPDNARYPMSAEKIGQMWRLLHDNGFASFAEA